MMALAIKPSSSSSNLMVPDLGSSAGDMGTGQTNGDHGDAEKLQEVDIDINNVVCSFNCRCHLSLHDIATKGLNVEYRKENGMVTMKLRQPYTTASIWSSGKITCTGANSEEQAHIAARRFARQLQKLGFKVRFCNYRVVNVLGTCRLPFAIKITQFSQAHRQFASYEPEIHPGVTYKLRTETVKATLKIFSTGSITVTAPSIANVQAAIEHIYPLVAEYQKPKTAQEIKIPPPLAFRSGKRKRPDVDEDDVALLDEDEDDDDDDDGIAAGKNTSFSTSMRQVRKHK